MYKESPYIATVPPQSFRPIREREREREEKKRREMEMEMTKDGREEKNEEEMEIPGFRFHPTDEELVGFYLRRKAEKKPLRIELIKQIDIYKFDPWDLSRGSNVGDKEHYFFCLRGRKYRNSIRPNRVTGSGFWKATGIDRQIYSQSGKTSSCIGLKKSLVYYKGSAGKGTKTDWMMHEYRLPDDQDTKLNPKSIQEMEVWTICRIFKRNSNFRKYKVEWREMPSIKPIESNSKACSSEPFTWDEQSYLSISGKVDLHNMSMLENFKEHDQISYGHFSIGAPYSSYFGGLQRSEDWDELGAVVDTALNPIVHIID